MVRCPTVVIRILRNGSIVNQRPVHTLCVKNRTVVAGTLEECIHSEAFPFSTETEVVENFRSPGAVANSHLVVCVNYTVVVNIFILDIARRTVENVWGMLLRISASSLKKPIAFKP